MKGLVVDNSAAVQLSRGQMTLNDSRRTFYAPELIDLEFANALRKLVLRRELEPNTASRYLAEWAANGLIRCSHAMMLPRIWALRDNITTYDASYVALAETLGLPLVTTDLRLAKAAARYCEVITVGQA